MSKSVGQEITYYEAFVNDVLKEDLRKIETRLQAINFEISDLIQQMHTLKVVTDTEMHPSGFKTQVNIGCDFFMEGSVTDTSTLLMNIGLNHFLEFSIDEANKYLDARIKAFEKKAEELRNQSLSTKAHIKMILIRLGELQNLSLAS